MDVQVDSFNKTRHQIDNLVGKSNGRDLIMKNSIFSITVGSNDFLNNYLLPLVSVGERIKETPDAFLQDLIRNLRIQLTVIIIISLLLRSKCKVDFELIAEIVQVRRSEVRGRKRRSNRMYTLPEIDKQDKGR